VAAGLRLRYRFPAHKPPEGEDGAVNGPSYTIRTMTRAEVDGTLDRAAAEGWNPGLEDALPFHLADPAGFLAGVLDGRAVAGLSAVRYGHRFAFIGLYIVDPAHRGRGHGRALWQAGMARLDGTVIGLDGVVARQDGYRACGFALAHRNIRYRAGPGTVAEEGVPSGGVTLVEARTVPFDRILDLDGPVFPARRPAFLAAWLSMPRTVALVAVQDGRAVGFGAVRPCREGAKIGPLVAPDAAVASVLLSGLAASAPSGPLFLDVPEVNRPAVALAEGLGMRPMFETARMYRGPAPALALERVFGITTFELG